MKLRLDFYSVISLCGTLALLAVLVGVLMLRQPLNSLSGPDRDKVVMETVLADFARTSAEEPVDRLLVREYTVTPPVWIFETPPGGVTRDTYRDFKTANKRRRAVSADLDLEVDYFVVTESEAASLLADDPNLARTRELGFAGPVGISRPGFDPYGFEALLFLETESLVVYYQLARGSDGWTVRGRSRTLKSGGD